MRSGRALAIIEEPGARGVRLRDSSVVEHVKCVGQTPALTNPAPAAAVERKIGHCGGQSDRRPEGRELINLLLTW